MSTGCAWPSQVRLIKAFETVFVLCAGRALAYLKEQQKAVAGSSYLQLKPVVLTTCKGTLQRLSKLPGWNRQSVRKKWVLRHSSLHAHCHTCCLCMHADALLMLAACQSLLSSASDELAPATHCSRKTATVLCRPHLV